VTASIHLFLPLVRSSCAIFLICPALRISPKGRKFLPMTEMNRSPSKVRRAGTLAAFAATLVGLAAPAFARSPECVQVSSEAIYRNMGYDHIVHIANTCDEAAVCVVSTNVNPEEQQVTVPAKERTDVLTFRGSPARTFVPHVACKLASESR
jgi:hypothetical protein